MKVYMDVDDCSFEFIGKPEDFDERFAEFQKMYYEVHPEREPSNSTVAVVWPPSARVSVGGPYGGGCGGTVSGGTGQATITNPGPGLQSNSSGGTE